MLFTPNDTLSFRPVTATVLIDVLKVDPVVTWNTPAPIDFGTALDATQLNAAADKQLEAAQLNYEAAQMRNGVPIGEVA